MNKVEIMVTTGEIRNPRKDGRKKGDWRFRDTVPAGSRFRVERGSTTFPDGSGGRIGFATAKISLEGGRSYQYVQTVGDHYESHPLARLILANSRVAAKTGMAALAEKGLEQIPDLVIDWLYEQGHLTDAMVAACDEALADEA